MRFELFRSLSRPDERQNGIRALRIGTRDPVRMDNVRFTPSGIDLGAVAFCP